MYLCNQKYILYYIFIREFRSIAPSSIYVILIYLALFLFINVSFIFYNIFKSLQCPYRVHVLKFFINYLHIHLINLLYTRYIFV